MADVIEKSCAYWHGEIPRRAARWAAEDAARRAAWERQLHVEQGQRAADWPVERIRALMATVTPS